VIGRAWPRRILLGAGVVLLGFYGCSPMGDPQEPPPPWLNSPLPALDASAKAHPLGAVPATVANKNGTFDPSAITLVLDDPRLAEVKALAARQAHKGAADKLAQLMSKAGADEPVWQYQLGRLRELAGDPYSASKAYDRAAAASWALTDHARVQSARLLVELGHPTPASTRLARVKRGTALDEALDLLRARAFADAGKVDKATPLYRAYLERVPKPKNWQVVALRYARSLLNQPSLAHAEEAVRIARMVMYESLGGRGVGEAREIEQQALLSLPHDRRRPFTEPELSVLAGRARALADAKQGREAMRAADQLLDKLGKQKDAPSEASCEAYLARCAGLGEIKRYAEASDACGTAIDRCEGQPRQVVALFLGGRFALRGGKLAEARTRYADLERKFPDHTYADDARLYGAQAALELGDVAAYTRMLSRVADDYPEGDMVDDALFALVRDRIERSDWAGTVVPLERAIAKQKRGRPYYAEGRPQYFLARARLALGQKSEGTALLESVIRDFPMSHYMLHAYARLASMNRARARTVLREAMASEPQGDFVIPFHEELKRPAFVRAIELVRQGDGDNALTELEALGVRDRSAHPSLLWASAFLLARIEAPTASHGLLRGSTDLWQEHYPAGVWRPVWEVAYPRAFRPVVEREAKQSGMPQHLLYAVMREESAFDPKAVSIANAHGLMQLIVPTAQVVSRPLGIAATATSLKKPDVNVALGSRYLSTLTRKFDYNPLLAIPGYNAGPGAPARWVSEHPADDFDLWIERIPYTETRNYTKRVIASMAAYAMLYGKGMDDALMLLPLVVQPGYVASRG